jgi:tryptophan synthase alpha chain
MPREEARVRIPETFDRLRAQKQKALVAYLCMGDPSEDESVALALAAVEAGAHILELGVPFSDPTADGPSIARASERAIQRGGGLAATLRAAAAIRAKTNVPIVLFGYYNPILVHGEAQVAAEAQRAGVDALLVVDLPIDESEPLRAAAFARGLSVIPLLAPTSTPERTARARATHARWPAGFAYYVSMTGVTGSAKAPLEEASRAAGALRESLGMPVVVGFGVDSPEKARAAATHADGVVVGSAIVRVIEEGKTAAERATGVTALVRALCAGLDSP